MKTLRATAIAVALIALGYFLRDAVHFVTTLDSGKVKLCSIETPVYDAKIDIFTDSFQEVSQPLYYEVHTAGQICVPMAFFGGTTIGKRITKDSFTIITGKDSKLVGVALTSNPHSILIIHNFATGENWPKAGYSEHFTSTHRLGEALLEHLKRDSCAAGLQLGGT